MRSWFILLFCLSASLIEPATLQESVEESGSLETPEPRFSANNLLQSILNELNDRLIDSSLTSIKIKEKQDDISFYGAKVWGLHLGTVRGEVKSEASVIVVDIEFPYLQFTLFADAGHNEGIVTLKVYDLEIRGLIYFDEDKDLFESMDSYVRGYTFMTIEIEGEDEKKINLKNSVNHSILFNILMNSLHETENLFGSHGPIDTDYKRRNIVANKTETQNVDGAKI